MSNEKMIVDILLFPGMVTVVDGVIVKPPPEVLLPAQNVVPRLALNKVKGLLPEAPVVLFQVTWTLETVIASCGLVIVIVIKVLLLAVLIVPARMFPQPGTGVEVEVGVKVMVGVKVTVGVEVCVRVGVIVGVFVTVLLGNGVNVTRSPPGSVGVGVFVGPLGIDVGVSVGAAVKVAAGVLVGPVVGTTLFPVVMSRIPRMVRALDEVIVRELIGISVSIGL